MFLALPLIVSSQETVTRQENGAGSQRAGSPPSSRARYAKESTGAHVQVRSGFLVGCEAHRTIAPW